MIRESPSAIYQVGLDRSGGSFQELTLRRGDGIKGKGRLKDDTEILSLRNCKYITNREVGFKVLT